MLPKLVDIGEEIERINLMRHESTITRDTLWEQVFETIAKKLVSIAPKLLTYNPVLIDKLLVTKKWGKHINKMVGVLQSLFWSFKMK